MNIVLYSNNCPRCNALKLELDKRKIKYTIFNDEEKMIEMGFNTMPILEVEGKRLKYAEAYNWVMGMNNERDS